MVHIVLVSFLADTFDFGLIIYELIDFIQHKDNTYSASKINSLFLIFVRRSSWNYGKNDEEKDILSHSYIKELCNLFKWDIRSILTILNLALIEHQTIINVSKSLLFLFNFLLLFSQWFLFSFLAPSLFLKLLSHFLFILFLHEFWIDSHFLSNLVHSFLISLLCRDRIRPAVLQFQLLKVVQRFLFNIWPYLEWMKSCIYN